MESLALEEKINKIRLRNEEIKRRYEEVEADKKNAAKLDALAKPIPQEDWPTRKEPPEFSAPVAKQNLKPKPSARKHNDQPSHHYTGSGEGKKNHTFADGQGPPPDPKYNFLADSEREEPGNEISKDSEKNRGKNKLARGGFKKRGSGRDWHAKELWNQPEASGNSAHPDYEAWRAERNRIDEARISRQRTAEGNWRREWDNDKFHLADENTKRENRISLGDVVSRQEYSENDKVYRSPRTAPRISRQQNARDSHQNSCFSEPMRSHGEGEKRMVVATEKSIKILLNPQATAPSRSSVMSVKVSPPNIAGTGRVGPRQRPRVTYSSSQSEAMDSPNLNESPSIARQRSIDESPRVRTFENNKVSSPKSPHYQRKSDPKNQFHGKKENLEDTPKSLRRDSQKSSAAQKPINLMNHSTQFSRDQRKSNPRNDDAKFYQAQKSSDTENRFSRETTNNGHDTEPKEFEETESTNVQNPGFQLESVPAESTDIFGQNQMTTDENPQENSPNSTDELPNVPPENSTINQHEKSSDVNDDDRATSNDSLLDSEPSEAINCSANSGIISNDSGFIELPSTDSFHDISENAAANKVDEECPESLPPSSEAPEFLPTVQIEETESKPETNTLPNDSQPEAADNGKNEKNVSEPAENIATEFKKIESSISEKSDEITQEMKELENSCIQEVEIPENNSAEKKENIDESQLEKTEKLSADDRNEICNKSLT